MYSGCTGELSCSCDWPTICKHLQAACAVAPFTHSKRLDTAQAIVSRGGLRLTDEEAGLCEYT